MTLHEPGKFFKQLGYLHDARIGYFSWEPNRQQIVLAIDDLNSNFLDLPEYKGLSIATITLSNVTDLTLNIDNLEPTLNIYELEVSPEPPPFVVQAKFSPSGKFKIICSSIEIKTQDSK